MKRHNDVIKGSSLAGMRQLESSDSRASLISLILITLLALTTLACAFLGPNSRPASRSIVIRNRLPTLTPTPRTEPVPAAVAPPQATAVAAAPAVEPEIPQEAAATAPDAPAVEVAAPDPLPSLSQNVEAANPPVVDAPAVPPVEAATSIPLPTAPLAALATETPTPPSGPTDTPPPTLTPAPSPWSFIGVQALPDPYGGGLLMHGNVINNTESAQELKAITSVFLDTQNQVIAATDSGDAYWPGYVVPVGGSMPFEMAVADIDSANNFDLNVEAESSDQIPRQDFEFSDLNQAIDEALYCVTGKLQNRGGTLQDYLVIAVIVYDSQNNVISFVYYEEFAPDWVIGDERLEFELCADLLGASAARHELQAWGR
jgi:hypothetical protein